MFYNIVVNLNLRGKKKVLGIFKISKKVLRRIIMLKRLILSFFYGGWGEKSGVFIVIVVLL